MCRNAYLRRFGSAPNLGIIVKDKELYDCQSLTWGLNEISFQKSSNSNNHMTLKVKNISMSVCVHVI